MNPIGLSREELARYAPLDAEVAKFVAEHAAELIEEADEEHAAELIEEADEEFYDPAGCYDNGFDEGETAGRKSTLVQLAETYAEQLLEWIGKVPNLALAGGDDPNELQTLLGALHAEFEDE